MRFARAVALEVMSNHSWDNGITVTGDVGEPPVPRGGGRGVFVSILEGPSRLPVLPGGPKN